MPFLSPSVSLFQDYAVLRNRLPRLMPKRFGISVDNALYERSMPVLRAKNMPRFRKFEDCDLQYAQPRNISLDIRHTLRRDNDMTVQQDTPHICPSGGVRTASFSIRLRERPIPNRC